MPANDPRSDILDLLKRHEFSVDELSPKLGISPTAIRQHLSILERDGLVKRSSVKEKMGRPKVFYSLTEKAEKLFPKAYSELIKWILKDMIEREGTESVRAMMGRLGANQAAYYKDRMRGDGDVESTVDVLNELGAFAEAVSEDKRRLIRVCNCPFYEVAIEFGEIMCEFGLKFIGGLLNSSVALERSIINGDRCCSYALGEY